MLLGIAGFIALSFAFPVVVSYWLDRRAHDGVDWFKRRRVLARGQVAEARILSSSLVPTKTTGSKLSGAYSIVYEVRPDGAAPFRTKAIEVMFFSEARANLVEGSTVEVRFDPGDHTVVLVRADIGKLQSDRDAARRAKEDALLRGS